MSQTITLPELIKLLSATTNSSESTARQFITELFAALSDSLAEGKKTKIKGLGTFSISEFNKSVEFQPDNDIAEAINHPFAFFEAVELDDETTDDELTEAEVEAIEAEAEAEAIEAEAEAIEATESAEATNEETLVEIADSPVDQSESDTVSTGPTSQQPEPVTQPEPKTLATVKEEDEDENPHLHRSQGQSEPNPWLMLTIGLLIGIIVGYLLPSLKEGLSSLWSDSHEATAPPPHRNEEKNDTLSVKTLPTKTAVTEPQQPSDKSEIAAENDEITDTIGRNKFLTTMSRKYFGKYEFWVYIYEENADRLGNPDKIAPGTVVTIPPAHKYDINPADPQSLRKAKLKAVEIYAPYQK